MNNPPFQHTKPIGSIKRRSVQVAQDSLVKTELLTAEQPLPVVVKPVMDGVDMINWARNNREYVNTLLLQHGGVLFRDFKVKSASDFNLFISAVSSELLKYRDQATPRSEVGNGIYTSTDYPADQYIELHNENCYAYSWPTKIFFCCITSPQQGGETPLADCRRVLAHLSPGLLERFIAKNVMYIRNFGDGFGIPWQVAFQVSNKSELEAYCRREHIEYEWKDEARLRTKQIRPAVVRHPRTNELVWFNQTAAFHVSTLDPAIRSVLLAELSQHDLPKNVLYGDGTVIDSSDLDEIRAAYRQETITFPWQEGDILMLDNILVAHGRTPFIGPRKVIVGMSDLLSWDDVTTK